MPPAIDASEHSIYTEGGKVQAGRGVYIVRKADAELYDCCMAGRIGYVLHTRQIGKSSLIASVSRALQQRNVAVAVLDLCVLGTPDSPEQWYFGILVEIAEQLGLETDIVAWWDEQANLSYTHRMRRFFSEVVVRELTGHIVVFFDEIDTTLALSYTDDFFAAIRELFQARDTAPDLARLSFVIAGSASPNDLMKDPSRTPFNVGKHIELTDFTFDEALPLARGFPTERGTDRVFLAHVLEWTSGHPYLTQVLASRIVRGGAIMRSTADIDELVRETFLSAQGEKDRNLRFVSDMLTTRAEKVGRDEVLLRYRDVLLGRPVPDTGQSAVICHLKLAGVVRVVADRLQIRNEIYRRAFGLEWTNGNISFSWTRLASRLTSKTVLPAVISAAIVLPLAVLLLLRFADLQAQQRQLDAQQRNLFEDAERIERLERQVKKLHGDSDEFEERLVRQRALLSELNFNQADKDQMQKREQLIRFNDETLSLVRNSRTPMERSAVRGPSE